MIDASWIEAGAAVWAAVVLPIGGFIHSVFKTQEKKRKDELDGLEGRLQKEIDNVSSANYKLMQFVQEHHNSTIASMQRIDTRLSIIEDRSHRLRRMDVIKQQEN